MKTKYERMNKNEKRDVYNKFKVEKKDLYKKLKRMFILCSVGIGYSLLIFIYDFLFKNSKLNYILDIAIFVFCVFYLIKVINTKKELLNDFVLKNDKK